MSFYIAMHEPTECGELSSQGATNWSRDPRCLDLRKLRYLGPEAALTLQSHCGALLLWGLDEIGSEVARNLSHYRGCLDLRGITTLSESAALSLGTTRGYLNLSGLKTLPTGTAAGLASQNGYLDLSGIDDISVEAVRELAQHNGFLDLRGIRTLSADSLCALSGDRIGLNLNGLVAIDPKGAEALAQAGRILCLEGLAKLDLPTIEALARGWEQNRADGRWIFFPNYAMDQSLPNDVAEILLRYHESWAFGLDHDSWGYEHCSAKQSEIERPVSHVSVVEAVDAARMGNDSFVRSIRRLTRDEAIALSHFEGWVGLYCLEELAVEVAEILAVRHNLDLDIDFPKSANTQAIVCLLPYLDRNPWIPDGWMSSVAEDVVNRMHKG